MSPKEPKHSVGFYYNYGDIQTPREIATRLDPKIFFRVRHNCKVLQSDRLEIKREHFATSAQRAKVVLLLTTSGRSLMPIVGRGRDKQAVLWNTRNHLRPRGEYAIDMYTFDTQAHAVYIRLV
ncbi:unnamed protein product [Porites evermanni]|uniref:Uncharacterized protein n=1 Tax=Porites evermanni TaxID=104178 RepID=A0ABN8M0J6_9CNID|nr:unnamed protein product [Porites evermanni]